jgi:hypothetical protein
VKRIEFAFRQRPIAPTQLYRNVVQPPRTEAAIEVPQSWYDNSNHRHLDVGAGLLENKEIKANLLGEVHASHHLLAAVEMAEARAKFRLNDPARN